MFKNFFSNKVTGIVVFVLGVVCILNTQNAQAAVPVIDFSANSTVIPVNTSTDLNWSVVDAVSCDASGSWSGSKSLSGTESTGNLLIDSTFVLICLGNGGEESSSQVAITVVDPPELTFFAQDPVVSYNTATNLIWNTVDATSCETLPSDWSGAKPIAGTESTGNLISAKNYTLQCSGPGGTVEKTVSITIDSPNPPPTLSFSADKYFIGYDESITLQWDSTNADACLAGSDWSGSKSTSGSQNSGNLQSDKHYVLICSGDGGSITRFVDIFVSPQVFDPPELTFTADDYNIGYGGSTIVRWTSTNAVSCSALGTFGWNKPLSGSHNTGALYSTKTYTLRCENPNGNVTQNLTINVGANPNPPPTLNFFAQDPVISYDTPTNLVWSTTDATSCEADDDWSGLKSTSGIQSTGNLTSDGHYNLSCDGLGGLVEKNITVTVGDPTSPPSVSFWADDYNVNYNSGTTLRWTSNHADWCKIVYNSTDVGVALNGNRATGNLTNDTIYSLSCGNVVGTTTKALTVTVSMSGPAPIINLWADENPIDYGTSTTVSWTVQYADECWMSGEGSVPINGSVGTGILYSAKTYTLNCVGSGGENLDSITININSETVPTDPPDLLFWADEYTILEGENTDLHWIASSADWCDADLGWSGPKQTSGDENTGILYFMTSYKLTCGNIQGEVTKTLTIEVGNKSDVQLDFWADDYAVPHNGSTTLRWDSTNANYCDTQGSRWGWGDFKSLDGSESTGSLTHYTNLYVLRCSNFLSQQTKSVTVYAGDPPPSVSFYASSYTIGYNTPVTLFWSSSDSTDCKAWNNGGEPTWNWEEGSVSGSQMTANLISNTEFYLKCYGPGGYSTKNVYIRVASQDAEIPTINFWADDYIVSENQSTFVHWTSQNADSCNAISNPSVGGWSGNKATNGSGDEVGPFAQGTELYLVCLNSSGSASALLNIQVGNGISLKPNLSFWADRYSLPLGEATTLRWLAINADDCVASNSWSGPKDGTGSEGTGPVNESKRYELTCSNEGGEITSFIDISAGTASKGPMIKMIADDYDIEAGEDVSLEWRPCVVGDGAECDADGDGLADDSGPIDYCSSSWAGAQSFFGSDVVNPDYTMTYTMTCVGPGGSHSVDVEIFVAKVLVCPSSLQMKKDQTKQLQAWYKQNADEGFVCEDTTGATEITNGYGGFSTDWSSDDETKVKLQATSGLIKALEYTSGVNVCAEYKEIKGCSNVQVVTTCWECNSDSTCSSLLYPAASCSEQHFADNAVCLRMCGLKWGNWTEIAP